jgi:hypothetical protein
MAFCLEARDQISHLYGRNNCNAVHYNLYAFRQQTRIQDFERKPSKNIKLRQLNQEFSDGQNMQYAGANKKHVVLREGIPLELGGDWWIILKSLYVE